MLSMKTLRVALVAALLAVPGLVRSGAYVLDNPSAPPQVLQYALETMSTDTDGGAVRSGRAVFSKLETPGPEADPATIDEAGIAPGVLLEDDGTWYLRVSLDGMVFAGGVDDPDAKVYGNETGDFDNDPETPDTTRRAESARAGSGDGIVVVSGGDAGSSSVIFRLRVSEPDRKDWIFFDFTDNLAAPKRAGDYGISMSIHSSRSDANSGTNHIGRMGSATLVRTLAGLNVGIRAFPGIEADVATGFLWFTKPGGGNRAQVDLGYAMVGVNEGTRGESLLHAGTGKDLMPDDLLDSPITMTVTGDLSIGAFTVQSKDNGGGPVECENKGRSESAPNIGNLVDSEGNNIRRSGVTDVGSVGRLEAGVEHHLCVDVDVTGPETNARAIVRQEFGATLSALTPADKDDLEVLGEGVIGRIGRNGASVNIAYLTTSDKHNQRLIIVNRGSSPINVSDVVFQTEDGTDVEMTPLAEQALEAMLGPGESVTMPVGDMLNITGDSRRTAATISFRGVKDNISVATTQVNREDSSTDTVMWPVE